MSFIGIALLVNFAVRKVNEMNANIEKITYAAEAAVDSAATHIGETADDIRDWYNNLEEPDRMNLTRTVVQARQYIFDDITDVTDAAGGAIKGVHKRLSGSDERVTFGGWRIIVIQGAVGEHRLERIISEKADWPDSYGLHVNGALPAGVMISDVFTVVKLMPAPLQ